MNIGHRSASPFMTSTVLSSFRLLHSTLPASPGSTRTSSRDRCLAQHTAFHSFHSRSATVCLALLTDPAALSLVLSLVPPSSPRYPSSVPCSMRVRACVLTRGHASPCVDAVCVRECVPKCLSACMRTYIRTCVRTRLLVCACASLNQSPHSVPSRAFS
jgi:hypothetical protein